MLEPIERLRFMYYEAYSEVFDFSNSFWLIKEDFYYKIVNKFYCVLCSDDITKRSIFGIDFFVVKNGNFPDIQLIINPRKRIIDDAFSPKVS